ncbi:MAG: hypothetical protein LIO58_08565 [Oscillospiraceae bacterium]|nr:hypothetical protein [Oscillospiraceae bacterium]
MKSIPIKKDLIAMMEHNFPDFIFCSTHQSLYGFTRFTEDLLYDHIIIQRDFYNEEGNLVITEVASCYNQNWRSHPWYTVGQGTDIAVLITGKHRYPAGTGWHSYGNTREQLSAAMDQLVEDINRYVLPYFQKIHEELAKDKLMRVTALYLRTAIASMQTDEIESFQQYMKAYQDDYSAWRKECLKLKKKIDDSQYSCFIPDHPLINLWMEDIKNLLDFPKLKDSGKSRIRKYIFCLFRDIHSYYT